jgi:O-antigen/teichoic acid export membrane protein
MSEKNNLIIKNSGILFFRLLCTSVIGLFTSRFIIRSLGASDFGIYSVVGGIVLIMGLVNTVMTSTTYRFIAFETGKGRHDGVNKIFNISLVIHLCLALFVLLITETVGVYYVNNYLNVAANKLDDALFVLRFSTYSTCFAILSIPYQGLIVAQENFSVKAKVEIVRSVLGLLVALVIVHYIGNRLRLYALLIAIANIVPSFLFFAYCKHRYREIVKFNFQRGISKYKEMIGFSGWLIFGTVAWVGQRQGADLIVNIFFGTVINAATGIANQVNSIVLMFARNLGQAAIPQITKSVSSEDVERTKTLVAYISKYTYFLMLLPALPILLETGFLLKLWLGELPPYTVIFCKLMIINALIESFSSGIPSVFMASGKVKVYMITGGLISLLSLPISYLLFKVGYPPYTILIIYIFVSIINVVVCQVLLKIILNFDVRFFLKTSLLKIFYVSVFMVPLFFISDFFQSGFIRFILLSVFTECWILTVIYFVGIEKEEKDMLRQMVSKMILWRKRS